MVIETFRKQVIMLDREPVITHFMSETRQLFETTKGSFVYFMDESKLNEINTDKYTLLLLKLLKLEENQIYINDRTNRNTTR